MEFDFLTPTVTIVSILTFTFYLNHRLEDKFEKMNEKNGIDHGKLWDKICSFERKLEELTR
mgnify:CR=1 FL=1